jgi:mannose/fructose/N-acetylgalactosamine-specific phosphotransferase system component IIC
MKNLFNRIAVGATVGVTALGLMATGAFAAAPVMDTAIQTGILDVITGLKDTIFANIIAVLPLAGVVLVTLVGIGVLFGFFHRIARH